MRLWRISNYADLSGKGGLVADGRWHSRGRTVVYLTDHPSTALLEILVHTDRRLVPDTYQLLEIETPDDVGIERAALSPDWQGQVLMTRAIGDRFLEQNRQPLLATPSIVMPRATNYLFNPGHSLAGKFRIVSSVRFPFDSRLFG